MSEKPTYEDLEKRVKDLEQKITESKTAEEALRQSEEKYRSILENIEDEYYEIDLEGKYTFLNQAVCKNQGLSREELIGMNAEDHMTPEEGKRLYKILREVYRTGIPANLINYEAVRKDGTVMYFEDSISLLKNFKGEPIGFSGIARNITERKKNEEALLRSEKEYRNILELSPDVIVITSIENGRFKMVNDAFCMMSGYGQEEVIGRTPDDLNLYARPEDREKLLNVLGQTGRASGVEIQYRAKDGTIHDFLFSSRIIRYKGEDCLLFVGSVITPLKEAQRALREREEKYRHILENMEEGYYEVDLAGNFIFFNEAECRIHERSPEEMKGLNNRDFSSPETAKRVFKIYNEVYRTGIPVKVIDYEVIVEDGSLRILETSASLMRNAVGEPIGFYGISRDVTERRTTEQALRESEEKYRNILDNMEEVYYEVDLAGNLTFFNPAMCESFGRTPDDLLGLNYRQYTSPEGASLLYSVFNEVFRMGTPKQLFDFPIIRSDGVIRTLEGSVSLLRNASGEPIGFRGIVRDKTEQKKAESALRESEEKYRLLVENANDGIYILQDGMVIFLNPRTEELTGYSSKELAKIPFIDLVHPKDRQAFVEGQQGRHEAGKRPSLYSFRLIRQGEETLWVELNTIEIVWEGCPATLNFLRDITPQKKMEAQFLQAQKMEAVGTLAGGIAHDFNNLLMGIQGNASLILLDIGSDHPHYSKIKNIEKQVQAGAELTRQLLGAARGGKYEARPTNINELIGRSLDLFGRAKKELRIYKYFQEPIWAVEVDRSQIEQVLLNLYVNAGHAMPAGGDLYVETKNIILDQSYLQPYGLSPGRFVRISVTDTGIGMDEATQKRAFDPFFTTREIGRGTGLGLASAYGIVKNHNGIINIYSEKGEGTTVNIYLPVTEKAVIEKPEMGEELFMGTESILLVDDEEAIADIGRRLLERLSYRVILAGSGAEAVEIYRREQGGIDLIILDMIMPGISGGETFEQIKAINPSVNVLLSSGYSINGQAKTILDRGCKGFLQKPFGLGDLSKKVRQVLDEKS